MVRVGTVVDVCDSILVRLVDSKLDLGSVVEWMKMYQDFRAFKSKLHPFHAFLKRI